MLHNCLVLSCTDGEDFLAGQSTIIFPAGEIRACENITIIDDDIMEITEEDFVVVLDEVQDSPLDPVVGDNSMAPVTIIDDDGKELRMQNMIYRWQA